MSLINQMLRDLEARRPAPATAGNAASLALAAERSGVAPVAPPTPRWPLAVIVLLATAVGLLLWQVQQKDSGLNAQDSELNAQDSGLRTEDSVGGGQGALPVSDSVVSDARHSASAPEHSVLSTQSSALDSQDSGLRTEDSVGGAQVALPVPEHSVLSTQSSALDAQHSALSTQHLVLSPQSSVLSPERAAPQPAPSQLTPAAASPPLQAPEPPPARVKTLRLRSLDGVTRIFVDLDRRAVHHTNLEGERFTLTLSGVADRPPVLPSLAGTPLADLDSRFAAGELHLDFRFDAPQRLLGSELRETADGVRLSVSLAAVRPVVAEPPVGSAPVHKQVRPLDSAQRAEQALRRGVGLLGQGRQAEAELALREAVALDPCLVQAREALVALYLNRGRVAESRELLAEGLRLAPRTAGLARLYARLLAEGGELAPALTVLQRALPPLADDPDYHALLAALYQRAGRHEPAAWTYRQLLARDGGNAAWWMGLAISLEALGEPAPALDAYVKAHRLGAGLSGEVLDYVSRRIRALAPGVAAARQAAGNADSNEE